MTKIIATYLSAFAILIGVSTSIYAQEENDNDSLSGETVIIVKEFEPVIKDGKKINSQPQIYVVKRDTPNFSYDLIPQQQTYVFQPDTIEGAKIKGEPLDDLYRAYIKAGMGNYLNNLGELHINNLRSRDLHWGFDVNHLGSNGGIKNLPYNGFSKTMGEAYLKKMYKKHIVRGQLGYENSNIYHYGIQPWHPNVDLKLIEKSDIKQNYQLFQGSAGLESIIPDSNELNYKIGVNYHNLGIAQGNLYENNVLLHTEFSKFYGTEKAFFTFDVDHNAVSNQKDTLGTPYPSNTLIKPSVDVRFFGKKWRLLAGFKVAVEAGENAKFFFFPNAEFKFNVVQNLIVPYVGVSGGIDRNSFQTLRATNPFITPYAQLKNTRTTYDAYLGVRGVFSSKMSYNLSGGYKELKDMVLFTSDLSPIHGGNSLLENLYSPVYDTVNIAYVSAQIGYNDGDKWQAILRLNYNNYQTKNQAVAWNLPDFKGDLTTKYNVQNKIIAKASLTFMSSRYAKTNNPVDTELLAFNTYGRKLDPIIDFNLGAEYLFTKRVSAFIDLNNILSQNYEIWGNYQVQGFNVMAGLTISFWEK